MQPRHHKGVSPLLQLNTKMISQFRLKPMHLVYEGVFKRLLEAWKNWISPWKLHWTVVNKVSDELILLTPSCPRDFARKPWQDLYMNYHFTKQRNSVVYVHMMA